ncbi:MAG: hypothetical protein HY268_32295 [Deltaproteobacteria bacterium]|nr:hypothetical protein [Deltaproteobacteria bacterium]
MTASDLRSFLLTLRALYAHGDLEHLPAHVLAVLLRLMAAERNNYRPSRPALEILGWLKP